RARHERGVFHRVRLLMDLAIDLGATSLLGWQPRKPMLARVDGGPRFDIIESHGPHPAALVVGILTSVIMFAAFPLLFHAMPLTNASMQRREQSGDDTRWTDANDSAQQTIAVDPQARHTLIAAIASTIKQRYVDRAIGQQLADALLAHDKKGEYR